MDYTVYKDSPRTDWLMKGIFSLPPAILLIAAAIYSFLDIRGGMSFMYGALAIAAVMGLLFLLVIPTRYCVLDAKLRIEFRAPLSLNIPFETISAVRDGRWSTVGINLPTNMSRKNLLEIVRKHGMTITISPSDKRAFAAAFEKAYEDWSKRRGQYDKTH
jgi:hypothetical protein